MDISTTAWINACHVIEAQRLELVADDKKFRVWKITDFAVPGDSKIEDKVME